MKKERERKKKKVCVCVWVCVCVCGWVCAVNVCVSLTRNFGCTDKGMKDVQKRHKKKDINRHILLKSCRLCALGTHTHTYKRLWIFIHTPERRVF